MVPQHRVVRRRAAWLASVFFFAATVLVVAQQDDPSEIFSKLISPRKQGEKLERQGPIKTALASIASPAA
jgi:hypothetical protein